MPSLLDELRRYLRRARAPGTIASGDAPSAGMRHRRYDRQSAGRMGAQDEHARWLGFADSPEYARAGRSRRDDAGDDEPLP